MNLKGLNSPFYMVNQWICRHADTTDNYHANIRVNDTLVTQGFKLYFPFNNVQEASQNPRCA
jgi:hypothetical protein